MNTFLIKQCCGKVVGTTEPFDAKERAMIVEMQDSNGELVRTFKLIVDEEDMFDDATSLSEETLHGTKKIHPTLPFLQFETTLRNWTPDAGGVRYRDSRASTKNLYDRRVDVDELGDYSVYSDEQLDYDEAPVYLDIKPTKKELQGEQSASNNDLVSRQVHAIWPSVYQHVVEDEDGIEEDCCYQILCSDSPEYQSLKAGTYVDLPMALRPLGWHLKRIMDDYVSHPHYDEVLLPFVQEILREVFFHSTRPGTWPNYYCGGYLVLTFVRQCAEAFDEWGDDAARRNQQLLLQEVVKIHNLPLGRNEDFFHYFHYLQAKLCKLYNKEKIEMGVPEPPPTAQAQPEQRSTGHRVSGRKRQPAIHTNYTPNMQRSQHLDKDKAKEECRRKRKYPFFSPMCVKQKNKLENQSPTNMLK